MGGSISISKFLRYEKGEGIEKKETDFAAEVASMIK
jgi:elongation factor Ts